MSTFGHYTSQSGLLGMLREQRLWATNIKYLNDKDEFQNALTVLSDMLKKAKLAESDPHFPALDDFQQAVAKRVTSFDFRTYAIFTLSFSEETDLLSQWRGYCPQSGGYCAIYDAPKLLEAVKAEFPKSHFVKCIYDLEEKKDGIEKCPQRALWRIRKGY